MESGKLALPDYAGFLEENLRKAGVHSYLSLNLFHIHQLAKLPAIHKDPFDRILLAQAIVEDLTLISKDRLLTQYPVQVFW